MNTKKIKTSFRKLLWNIIKRLPSFLKNIVIRNMFQVPDIESMDLVFKRASTEDEIEQAARLLYSSYFEFGLVPENKIGKRLTKYHALPQTCLLIAKDKEQVIATISVIPNTAFGLPLEALWDISFIKNKSTRVVEISCLAISYNYRRRKGEILFPLFRLLKDYAKNILGADHLLIATHPDVSDFYSSLMLFKPISDRPKIYEFVQGAPAYGQYVKMDEEWFAELKRIYGSRKKSKNLYQLAVGPRPSNIQVPDKNNIDFGYVFHSPEYLKNLFEDQLNLISQMKANELKELKNIYYTTNYETLFKAAISHFKRKTPRFKTNIESKCYHAETHQILKSQILDISYSGILMKADLENAKLGDNFILHILENPKITLTCQAVWINQDSQQIGLSLVGQVPQSWLEKLNSFEDLLKQSEPKNKALRRSK